AVYGTLAEPSTRVGHALSRMIREQPRRGYTSDRQPCTALEGGASDDDHHPRPAYVEGARAPMGDAHRLRFPHRPDPRSSWDPGAARRSLTGSQRPRLRERAPRDDGGDAPPHAGGHARRRVGHGGG